MILTLPAHTKLTFMDYLLTFLQIMLQRKLDYDRGGSTSRGGETMEGAGAATPAGEQAEAVEWRGGGT